MEGTLDGLGHIPLLPLDSDDLKILTNALDGYLAYIRLAHLLSKGQGAFLISAQELKALKEAAQSLVALMTCIVPPSGERDRVLECLQALCQQFGQMLAPFVN